VSVLTPVTSSQSQSSFFFLFFSPFFFFRTCLQEGLQALLPGNFFW